MLIDLNDAHVRPTQVFEHLRLSHCKKWKDMKACISRVSFASCNSSKSLNASLSCVSSKLFTDRSIMTHLLDRV